MTPDIEQLTAHSIVLNDVLWRMALILGDVVPGDGEYHADIYETIDRFFTYIAAMPIKKI